MRLPALNRSTLMLGLALVAGLCAAWAARQHLHGRELELEARARIQTVERVVAAHDLPPGTRIGPEHLAVRSFPAVLASSDSLPPERHGELAGTVLRMPLRAGDAVLPAHTAQQAQDSFSSHLVSGRRAITMPVDAINSVSGLLQPGDLIDLYVSFEYQRRRITAPLLQGVLVLATGTTTQHGRMSGDQDTQAYATVTLDAAPEDAVKLVAARQSGTLTAVLRHPQDDASNQAAVRGDLAGLLGVNRPAPPASAKAPVIYGNSASAGIPRLRPAAATGAQPSGLFELPGVPELVSAWLWAASTDPAGAQAPGPYAFPAQAGVQEQ
ncbi:Flp pilus assembly protein CpaB [Parapusillimonas granuli]|uniref:Flp pilus assembly protein CpaB n=1 Tax=Parapusillimonas granuli TaxID=380911 RepID=A0A853G8R5_9BURK|nr:Flp pilus assembly protein CpaB [Parapusillimonas granuli]MBB5214390.1 pilus assembly protein CpaB [Parapusillimonas granuli]NYT51076.1 Flp pilus assembly protein CpaB [Parapusillimonas granuli]